MKPQAVAVGSLTSSIWRILQRLLQLLTQEWPQWCMFHSLMRWTRRSGVFWTFFPSREGLRGGVCGRVVKALDQRSKGLGFDSRNAGHVCNALASFESTLPLSTQQLWVPGAHSKVGSVLAAPLWPRRAGGGKESAEHACMDIRL